MKKIFLNLSYNEILEHFTANKIPSFRLKQIFHWVYKKNILSFDKMNNLPDSLIYFLNQKYLISTLTIEDILQSSNNKGTVKIIYKTTDHKTIETVLIPNTKNKYTLCLSSQIGCDMACDFCATGKMGLTRSLNIDEILGQYMSIANQYPISNIVFMGMGEPFLNPDFFPTLERLIEPLYIDFMARSITVSTSGIVEGIREMINYKQVRLALSYHSSIPETRHIILETLSLRHSYEELMEAITEYWVQTKKRITLEYTLIKNINDSKEEAEKLLELNKQLYFFLNIIPYNEHEWASYQSPSEKDIQRFVGYLKDQIEVNVRYSKGDDIQAACGQLSYQKHLEKEGLKDV